MFVGLYPCILNFPFCNIKFPGEECSVYLKAAKPCPVLRGLHLMGAELNGDVSCHCEMVLLKEDLEKTPGCADSFVTSEQI